MGIEVGGGAGAAGSSGTAVLVVGLTTPPRMKLLPSIRISTLLITLLTKAMATHWRQITNSKSAKTVDRAGLSGPITWQ